MRLNTIRRATAIAGLALVPALAFGAAAQASPAAAPQPTTAAAAEQAPTVREPIAEIGTVSQIGNVETPDGPIVTFKFAPEGPWWVIGADTEVLKDGEVVSPQELREGDQVTAEGELDGEFVDAASVEIG
ncbi:hypothetical protein ACL03H_03780 [Saccharopolyspora sp. MS10]|uniref:hypothetical protein n=1 Tax=Saccharopolyspora sp. MS10 TaxID=3385973 RepID=UPI0039A0A429